MNKRFEEVAGFCERRLETTHGQEIGMTFGAVISALGRLADHTGDADDPAWRRLNKRANKLLLDFSMRFLVDHGRLGDSKTKPLEPSSMRTNMAYDPGKQEKD